jgi:flagellar hook-associated protein 3 FlgL
MRVTNNMIPLNLLTNLTAAENRLMAYQTQMNGIKISKSSDDPVGIANVMQIRNALGNVDQWKKNADEAISLMDTSDTKMAELKDILDRVRVLTVDAANAAKTPADKKLIAMEVDQLTDQIRNLANTQVGSRYIFGGTRTDQEPLPTGATVWKGNDEPICFQIGSSNNNLPISINGTEVFGDSYTTNTRGYPTANVLDTLAALSMVLRADPDDPAYDADVLQDDLRALLHLPATMLVDDPLDPTGPQITVDVIVTISGMLDHLDGHIDNGLSVRADLGARVNRMETVSEHLDAMSFNLTQNLSDVQDMDLAEAITQFLNQENIYKAALSTGANMIQPSLVDFIS